MNAWARPALIAVFVLLALGMAPLSAVYFKNLWLQTHYQFFPLLIAAAAVLLYSRWKVDSVMTVSLQASDAEDDEDEDGQPRVKKERTPWWPRLRPLVAICLMLLGIAIEFAAIWLFAPVTPWGGYLGLLVAGFGAVLYLGTGRPVALWPAWALMALILMPPNNADDKLITFLQHRTASFSSRMLDILGVDHNPEGVIINTTRQTLFVEEACSGVQSLFSLMAVAAVLAVWHSRSVVHTLLLFVAAAAGAGATNVFRTVAIVYGLDQLGVDLLAEPQHTILGLVVFSVALGWLMCCDGFLTFLLRPIDSPDFATHQNAWVILWNRLIAGFRLGPPPVDHVSRGKFIRGLCRAGLAVVAVASLVLSIASTTAVLASLKPGANPLLQPVEEGEVLGQIATMNEDSLPKDFDGWMRVRFEEVTRKESNDFGEHSRIWGFTTPYGLATCSVDYPFRGWHDLRVCYQGRDWITSDATTFCTAGADGTVDATEYTLRKRSGEYAVVMFAAFNERLEAVPTREVGGLAQSMGLRIQQAITATDNIDVIAQAQILLQPNRTLTDEDLADAREHLSQFRLRVFEHLRAKEGQSR